MISAVSPVNNDLINVIPIDTDWFCHRITYSVESIDKSVEFSVGCFECQNLK